MIETKEQIVYHYIIVRQDLPIEAQAVNIAHAAGESIIDAPIPVTTRCVLLHVPNEQSLLEYAELLTKKDIRHVTIREPDAPYMGAAMAIGLAPSTRHNALRRLFYHLKLFKYEG